MEVSSNSGELANLLKNDRFLREHWGVGKEDKKKRQQFQVGPDSGGEAPSGSRLSAKGLDAGHLDEVGLGFEGHGQSAAVAGGQRIPGSALLGDRTVGTEVEGPCL
jgi:hypothetical protein